MGNLSDLPRLVVNEDKAYEITGSTIKNLDKSIKRNIIGDSFVTCDSQGDIIRVKTTIPDNPIIPPTNKAIKKFASYSAMTASHLGIGKFAMCTDTNYVYCHLTGGWFIIGIFSGTSIPSGLGERSGDKFYHTTEERLYFYNGTDWIAQPKVFVQSTAPTSKMKEGDFFVNTTNHLLFCYLNTAWASVSHHFIQSGTSIPSGMTAGETLYDTTGKKHYCYDGTNLICTTHIVADV